MKLDLSAIKELDSKFDELSVREKTLALISGLVLVLFGGYVWLVEPVQIQIDDLNRKVQRQSSQLGELDEQIVQVEQDLETDPNEPLRKRRDSLQVQIVDIDERLREQTVDLIPANKMPEVLEKILSSSSRLKLLRMDSIPPVRMMDINSDSGARVNLFQHGVLLMLEGSYHDILSYLEQIENLEWRFYWKRFDYLVDDYPKAKAEIELYTLSTSRAFIGV
ncbi:MAG: type II secretion system protein GspM [Aestuariibacter sp.]